MTTNQSNKKPQNSKSMQEFTKKKRTTGSKLLKSSSYNMKSKRGVGVNQSNKTINKVTKTVLIDIERLAHGGEGIGKHEDKIFIVEDAFPQDKVLVSVLEEKPKFARACTVDIISKSPLRVDEIPCQFQNSCGGCPWMPMTKLAQLNAKEQILLDALQRIGKFKTIERGVVLETLIPSSFQTRYRNRVRFYANSHAVGFKGKRSHNIVDIPSCVVMTQEVENIYKIIRNHILTTKLKPKSLNSKTQIEINAGKNRLIEVAVLGDNTLLKNILLPPNAQITSKKDTTDDPSQTLLPFMQANDDVNENIRSLIRNWLDNKNIKYLLDVFCGSGNFSLPLSDIVSKIVGIDNNVEAVKRANDLAPTNAKYIVSDVLSWVNPSLLEGCDAIILDPPRQGAIAISNHIARSNISWVVYVSCDPATLARDLRILVDGGYTIQKIQPFDMMPQTAHVESVVFLEKQLA